MFLVALIAGIVALVITDHATAAVVLAIFGLVFQLLLLLTVSVAASAGKAAVRRRTGRNR